MVVHTCTLSTWKAEAQGPGFNTSLSYMRSCIKNKPTKNPEITKTEIGRKKEGRYKVGKINA